MNFQESLGKFNIEYYTSFNTAKLSTIRAGGAADYIAYPSSDKELKALIGLAKQYSVKFKIIGMCSNTFFSDSGFPGIIICTKKLSRFRTTGRVLTAECGVYLPSLIRSLVKENTEFSSALYGIPATVGGAIKMNAGAFGETISDNFISGEFLEVGSLSTVRLTKEDLIFSYRHSYMQNDPDLILLSASFIVKKDRYNLHEKIKEIAKERRSRHPIEPSLGSFFKRSGGVIPARLIDESGLKGYRYGGAGVSDKHCGFIINADQAKACDIIYVADHIKNTIKKNYGITLTEEVEFVK